jgi:hypothetical protein
MHTPITSHRLQLTAELVLGKKTKVCRNLTWRVRALVSPAETLETDRQL